MLPKSPSLRTPDKVTSPSPCDMWSCGVILYEAALVTALPVSGFRVSGLGFRLGV